MNDKKAYETRVATKFLSALNEGWRISEDKRERPDFILTNATTIVGLELTRYREQGVHNVLHSRDWQLCEFIYDRWCEDASVNHFDLFLAYRKSNDQIRMPSKTCWSGLLDELRSLVCSLDTPGEPSQFWFDLFEKVDEDFERFLAGQPRRYLNPEDYPLLCRHFYKVVASFCPDLVAGRPCTSLSSRNTGADTTELRRVLDSKIKKVEEYRANLPIDAELWLLIHNDGWPSSAHIANDIILNELLQTAGSILNSSGEFARAYWLTDADVQPSGSLHVVYPGE